MYDGRFKRNELFAVVAVNAIKSSSAGVRTLNIAPLITVPGYLLLPRTQAVGIANKSEVKN